MRLHAAQAQLLLDARRPMAGMGERVVENSGFDLGADAVGVWPAGAGQPVEQAFRAIGLEVAADLVKLLARIAHDFAGSRNIGQFGGKIEQAELATCYLIGGGHRSSPVRVMGCLATPSNPLRSGPATGTGGADPSGPPPVLSAASVR
jgi:hypothetical protein